MPQMKIALVHDWLTGMRGGEKCLEILCRRFPSARLYTLLHVPGRVSPAIERMRITTSFLQRFPGVRRYYRCLLPLMPAAAGRLRIESDVDLVLSFSHAVAKAVRSPPGVPHVCYCFTPMRYAWHRRADYLRGSGLIRRIAAAVLGRLLLDPLRRWDRATADRVTRFVAVSRTVAARIAVCYGRDSRVIYPPVDTRFYTPDDSAREDFYVCVSALVPYKRVDLAIEACNRLRRRLIVIGDGPQRRRLARLAGPTVTLTGWQSGEEIRRQLRRARALLFPANEDFGIVPVEAQACGTPVIAFGAGGATESILPADESMPGTGLFFESQTPESLGRAIERLEANLDRFDPQAARRQAERFAAAHFEQQLIGLLQSEAAATRRGLPKRPKHVSARVGHARAGRR